MLNTLKERERVSHGKPAKLPDLSMNQSFTQFEPSASATSSSAPANYGEGRGANSARVGESDGAGDDQHLGDQAFTDMTDRENDEFQYLL